MPAACRSRRGARRGRRRAARARRMAMPPMPTTQRQPRRPPSMPRGGACFHVKGACMWEPRFSLCICVREVLVCTHFTSPSVFLEENNFLPVVMIALQQEMGCNRRQDCERGRVHSYSPPPINLPPWLPPLEEDRLALDSPSVQWVLFAKMVRPTHRSISLLSLRARCTPSIVTLLASSQDLYHSLQKRRCNSLSRSLRKGQSTCDTVLWQGGGSE